MTIILGLDPGISTGWSFWEYDETHAPLHLDHGIIGGGLKGFIEWFDGDDIDEVVCESFRLDGRTLFPEVMPLRIEGALAVLWPNTHFQPNTMKLHLSDRKMKELGIWWKGPGHDRDSARHVYAYLKSHHHRPTLELWRTANKGLQ
jgi:hypothetical protein